MKHFSSLVIILIITTTSVKANDSTLSHGRIQKLQEFSGWLKQNAKEETPNITGFLQYDSATNKNWQVFDRAISLYYNKVFVDSVIADTLNSDAMFSGLRKLNFMKAMLSTLNFLAKNLKPEDLKFRAITIDKQYEPSETHKIEIGNTFEQYFILNGEDIPYLIFQFEENSTKLNGMMIAFPQGETGEKLKKYFESLVRK